MTLAVLIRAHQFTIQEAYLAERLEAAFQASVTFVTDDTHSPVDTGRFAKIGIRKYRVRELIGGRYPPQWGWQCGDVFYYAAAEALPNAAHLALIEADVFLNAASAQRLADLFNKANEDILASQLERTENARTYSKDLEHLGRQNTVTGFFPITRVSRRAIGLMQDLRRRERQHGGLRLNDEAILASVAFEDDVTSLNLSKAASDIFDRAGFNVDGTQLFEHVRTEYQGDAVLHPVRSLNALLARIEEFGTKRNFRRRYRIAMEQAIPRHRQKLRRALAAADARRVKDQA